MIAALVASFLAMPMFAALPVMAASAPASGWDAPQLIVNDPRGDSLHVQVAADDQGRGLAVWEFTDGVNWEVHASHYTPSGGWQFPDRLTWYTAESAVDPDVGMDAQGNGLAVWTQAYYGQNQILMAPYTLGEGWGVVEFVAGNLSADQQDPEVSVGKDGSAAIVWVQCCDPDWQAWGRFFDPVLGWFGASRINGGGMGGASAPRVGVAPEIGAVAVWVEAGSGLWAINGSMFVTGLGWSPPASVAAAGAYATRPALAVSGNGDALALWERQSGLGDIEFNRFTPAGGWGISGVFATESTGPVEGPHVAMDAKGNGVAMWHAYTPAPNNKNTVRAQLFDAAFGWSPEVRELENVSYDAGRVSGDVAMDSAGNVVAVWVEGGTQDFDIKSATYSKAASWSDAQFVEDITQGAGHDYNPGGGPRVALGDSGQAVAAWVAYDASRWTVWGNAYGWPDGTPPRLTVLTPLAGATTTGPSIWVSGTTEPGAEVSVNGAAAGVDGYGSFGLWLALPPGSTTVVVAARDPSGNTATTALPVTYADPVPGLEQQLSDAQANLSAAQMHLADLEANASATSSELAAARADVAALEARQAATEANLTRARADLAAAEALSDERQALVQTLRDDLNTTKAAQAASTSSAASAQARADSSAAQASSSQLFGILGMVFGAAGLGVAALNLVMRRRPPGAEGSGSSADEPTKEQS